MRAGGFDPALSVSADWDLLLRMLLTGRVAYLDELLVRYRVHDANMSLNIAAMDRDMHHAFAKAFANPRLPDPLHRQKRRAYARLERMLAGSYAQAGKRRAAVQALGRSLRYDPSVAAELVRRRQRRSATSS